MINRNRNIYFTYLILSSIFVSGCATTNELIQAKDYPPDTPIVINDLPYEVNAIKCAKITSVSASGELDCYDS